MHPHFLHILASCGILVLLVLYQKPELRGEGERIILSLTKLLLPAGKFRNQNFLLTFLNQTTVNYPTDYTLCGRGFHVGVKPNLTGIHIPDGLTIYWEQHEKSKLHFSTLKYRPGFASSEARGSFGTTFASVTVQRATWKSYWQLFGDKPAPVSSCDEAGEARISGEIPPPR